MDYKEHYNRLIARGLSRTFDGYTERHHILPRCLGGTDEPQNLVRLTAEEHYVAHQLLIRIHPNSHKLVNATMMMCAARPTNKVYGWLRRRLQAAQKINQAGEKNSAFGTKWIYKGDLTIKCQESEVAKYLDLGWIQGRKPKNVAKPKFVKVCKCCKMTFETESKNKRHCSDECRVKSIPNIVAENFDRLYPLYVKYGAVKPAFAECGIGITKTVYDRFFKEIEKRNAGVA